MHLKAHALGLCLLLVRLHEQRHSGKPLLLLIMQGLKLLLKAVMLQEYLQLATTLIAAVLSH